MPSYDEANILSKLFYLWIFPVLKLGNGQFLEQCDLVQLSKHFKSEYLLNILSRNWSIEKNKENPSLTRAVIKSLWFRYIFYIILLITMESCVLSQTFVMGELLACLQSIHNADSRKWAIIYTIIMCMTTVVAILTRDPYFFTAHHIGISTRVSCSALIYKKVLMLNQQSFAQTTTGQIINLLTNDVRRLDTAFIFLHYIWLGPVISLLVLYLLYQRIGAASFAGVGALILLSPIQAMIGRYFAQVRHKTANLTDERVKIVSEIVNGMRIVKMYCWEKLFQKHLDDIRSHEMKHTNRYLTLQSVIMSQWLYQQKIATLLALGLFLVQNKPIDASIVFPTIAYLSYLRVIIILFVPMAITGCYEANVAFKRIKKFLLLPELDESKLPDNSSKQTNSVEIAFEKFTASWDKKEKMETLKQINLNVKGPCLIAVVGPVAAGKSSLLMAILKELSPSEGSVWHTGSIAYSAQQPWIFSASIRENILFGKEFKRNIYIQVLEATTLSKDIDEFPDGDLTLVGERGVSLSGGQRARISLARAVYADRDIVLLDDPFSAVDAKVGKQIFEKCVRTMLRNKLVIFVTHQSRFLRSANKVIVLDQGEMIKNDSFNNLLSGGFDFEKLLQNKINNSSPENASMQKSMSNLHGINESNFASMESLSDFQTAASHQLEELNLSSDKKKSSKEERETGNISSKVFTEYILMAGNWIFFAILVFVFSITVVIYVMSDWWLAYWSNIVEENNNLTLSVDNSTYMTEGYDNMYFFSIYAYLCAAIVFFALLRMFYFFRFCMRVSRKMHNRMIESLLRAPVRFFDTNAAGKILNRFSKDVGIMDDMIPLTTADFLQCFGLCLGIIATAFYSVPYVIIITIPLCVAFFLLRRYYIKPSQEIKRLEAIARSPVFSLVSNTIQGLGTVRAWNCQERFLHEYFQYQNDQTNCSIHFLGCSRWFSQRLEIICALFTTSVLVAILLSAIYGNMPAGTAGFAITYVIGLFSLFQWTVRQSTETQNHFISVERILEYTKLEEEPAYESLPQHKPPANWPSQGRIEFKDLSLYYSSDLPPALKSISITIRPGEKIGVVGRTGAGKSSLIVALFRLSNYTGRIIIDDVDISTLGLRDLRQKLSIIPQDPVLFAGTIRRNLDPFNQVTDDQIWQALEEVQLKRDISNLNGGLQNIVSEGGTNISVGQRQLLCLARALLRHNKILLVDEATANVDSRTDSLIQKTIRSKFHDCTVLTIAHRLHTIMDSDRVIVMDRGMISECDSPHILLTEDKGIFHNLVQQTSASDRSVLQKIAEEAYSNTKNFTDVKSVNDNCMTITDLTDVCINGLSETTPMLPPKC